MMVMMMIMMMTAMAMMMAMAMAMAMDDFFRQLKTLKQLEALHPHTPNLQSPKCRNTEAQHFWVAGGHRSRR